ncbi:MAG: hypothetical protein JNL24_02690 [Bacteroidia bacterium]|nr:hypothetical protein [Bacteroidia bacterium]
MKKIAIILLLTFITSIAIGQSLFFDNINNSIWTSDANYNDSTIRNAQQIGLGKLNGSVDSLKIDLTVWTFKNGILTISHYTCKDKKTSAIATYEYATEEVKRKTKLKLIFSETESALYGIGITSIGNYSLLIRENPKKNK